MKTVSNDLFELIKTLSPNEINSFRTYCVPNNSVKIPDYLLLFNHYAKLNSPNEEKIKGLMKNKNFERLKNYLHKQLFNFIAEAETLNIEKEVTNMILVANSLFARDLLTQGLAVLAKAKKIATKREMFHYVLIINEKIHAGQSGINTKAYNEYYVTEYEKQEFEPISEKLRIEQEVRTILLKRKLFNDNQISMMRTKEAFKYLDDHFLPIIKKGESYPKSFKAKIEFCIIAAYYYQQYNNYEKATYYFQKAVDLFENENPMQGENHQDYIIALHNLLFSYARVKNFVDSRSVLDKLTNLTAKNRYQRTSILRTYCLYESNYCRHNYNYEHRKRNLKVIETNVTKYQKDFSPVFYVNVMNNLSVNYFIQKDFKKALEWVNLIEGNEASSKLVSHLCIIKIYKLIIYYELDKIDLLSYAIRNTYRYILKNRQFSNFEKHFFTALKKIVNEPSRIKQNKIWLETKDSLLELKETKEESQVFLLFNFTGWINCHVNKQDYFNLMNEV